MAEVPSSGGDSSSQPNTTTTISTQEEQDGIPLTPLETTPEGASSVLEGVTSGAGAASGVDNPAFLGGEDGEGIDLEPDATPAMPEVLQHQDTKTHEEAPIEVQPASGKLDDDARESKSAHTHVTDEKNGAPPPTIDVESEQVKTAPAMAASGKTHVRVTSSNASPYDNVLPADKIWTTDREEAVRIRMGDNGLTAEPPTTVPSMLIDTATKAPTQIAIAAKDTATSPWRTWTYQEYLRDVRQVAKGFLKLGLEPQRGVGILGFNAPQWHLSLLGSIFAGGIGTGIYTTNSAEAVHYVLEHCEANVAVVEDKNQLAKVLAVRDRLPHLKAIVQYKGELDKREENLYTWKELLEKGNEVSDDELDQSTRLCAPNKCCSLIYTSGTTGSPKGVMLSHDNVTWTAKAAIIHLRFRWAKEVSISFLPLSHIAAQLSDIFVAIASAGTVHFAQPDALKGSLGATLKEVRPTAFLAVPRVWEKLAERLRAIGKQTKGCKKKISTWAKGVGLRSNLAMMKGQSPPLSFKIANAVVFKKVKAAMGLDRCHSFLSGAAPISRDIVEYFMSLNMPITEIYGMSESTGPQHIGVAWDFLLGTVGPVMAGAETILVDQDKEGNGEICFSGRHVFMGYLNNEEKTREAIDDKGLLHSGDIGKFDESGRYLSITGRIKELIITAGGENVAPVPIEENVKHELDVVSNAMLIGDKRKFLSILLTLKTVVDPDTMVPGDRLAPEAVDWVRSVGSSANTLSEILQTTDSRVMRGIQAGLDRANAKAVSRAQKVQKWSILPVDFSVPGGELGPSLKLKRPVAAKIYAKTIEAFYQGT